MRLVKALFQLPPDPLCLIMNDQGVGIYDLGDTDRIVALQSVADSAVDSPVTIEEAFAFINSKPALKLRPLVILLGGRNTITNVTRLSADDDQLDRRLLRARGRERTCCDLRSVREGDRAWLIRSFIDEDVLTFVERESAKYGLVILGIETLSGVVVRAWLQNGSAKSFGVTLFGETILVQPTAEDTVLIASDSHATAHELTSEDAVSSLLLSKANEVVSAREILRKAWSILTGVGLRALTQENAVPRFGPYPAKMIAWVWERRLSRALRVLTPVTVALGIIVALQIFSAEENIVSQRQHDSLTRERAALLLEIAMFERVGSERRQAVSPGALLGQLGQIPPSLATLTQVRVSEDSASKVVATISGEVADAEAGIAYVSALSRRLKEFTVRQETLEDSRRRGATKPKAFTLSIVAQ